MENNVKIFNTLTRKVETFVPNEDGKVKMYTCGPTVYHFAHIGNLRSYIMEDVLEKTLRYAGYDVKRVMNITDVGHLSSDADTGEDKMLKGAKREHKTVMEIAKYYTDAFFSDCSKLNIKRPDVVEPATNCIPEFIHMIEVLLEKGYAYIAGENVYFDTSKLDDYYVFSSQSEKELMVGVRDDVSEDENKRNKSDFVLWFTKSKFDNQELKWDSPWGVGYPGWHIECSCISMKHLGEYMDIHCGGVDNIFPHHTNEIAQSEAYLGHKWCNYWFHVHHLNDKSGKMSKSKGDFLTVSLLEEKGYLPLVYRMFCLQSHYRKPLEFSYEVMDNMENSYVKLRKTIAKLDASTEVEQDKFDAYKEKFLQALEDDLNTSMALTVVYEVLKADMTDATKLALVKDFDYVLSLDLAAGEAANPADEIDADLEAYVLEKIEERKAAKKEKDFAKADAIRNELLEKGIVLEDTREGVKWKKGIDSHIKEYFDLPKVDVATYSPLALAYIGDGIYDLVIRSIVVGKGNTKASRLHQTTSHLVKAHAQATMMETLTPMLTEDETEIYRRGRNAKSPTMAKNATMSDYRRATGFEALMGYLYLTDQFERILELAKEAIRHYNVKTGKNDLAGGK